MFYLLFCTLQYPFDFCYFYPIKPSQEVGLRALRGNLASTSGTHVSVLNSHWPCQSPLPEATAWLTITEYIKEDRKENKTVARSTEDKNMVTVRYGNWEAESHILTTPDVFPRKGHAIKADNLPKSALTALKSLWEVTIQTAFLWESAKWKHFPQNLTAAHTSNPVQGSNHHAKVFSSVAIIHTWKFSHTHPSA